MEIQKEFIEQSIVKLDEYTSKIEQCLLGLEEEEIWLRPNENSNSIGNLILHLQGNITQYIISSLNQQEDRRERDNEFTTTEGYSKDDLIKMLSSLIAEVKIIIKKLTDKDLLKVRSVQGFQLSGLAIVLHVVEHYSYHTGQIVFWTKLLKNKDLGFYKDFDLDQKNIIT
jgi:uncharacterized damage-inducible protein DinB